MENYSAFLEAAIIMARSAGNILMDYFRSSSLDIRTKLNDSDVVTAADKASENILKSIVHEKFPDHGIISEESGAEHAGKEWRWVIDPLDGTTNFSQGLPVFCVSIALEHNGEAVVGVVYAPYLGELFHAVKGGGAFFNGNKIKCSDKISLSETVAATGMPYDKLYNPDNNLREIINVAPNVRGVRRMGSAAMDLSYVGAGFYDAYWELNVQRWDVAAGLLIAKEAGAITLSLRENRNFSVLVACPGIYQQIKNLLM